MKAIECIISFAILVFLGACLDEDLSIDHAATAAAKTYPLVDQELWPHFASFEEEALRRGHRVDLSQAAIVGEIEEIHQDQVAGTCAYSSRRSDKHVTIDKSFWDRASEAYREYIVFHELGHCYLYRGHMDQCRDNQTYASLMRSGTGGCYDHYTSQTRAYYIDELFSVLVGP